MTLINVNLKSNLTCNIIQTFDLVLNSPFDSGVTVQGNLEGDSSILFEVTDGFTPGTPSITSIEFGFHFI